MANETKRLLNKKTKELGVILERAFRQENLEYDMIHSSYNSRNDRNDDEILFITCYIEKHKPYGIHIDNRLESDKWVIDIVLMKPDLTAKVIHILESNGYTPKAYHGVCHGEFEGHRRLLELDKETSLNDLKDINIKLLKIFQ